MDSLIGTLISGELTTTTLLLLFVISLLTKRFVPWWIYEAMEERLKFYEKEAPSLIDEVQTLLDELNSEQDEVSKQYPRTRRPYGNSRNKSKRGGSDDNSRNSS